MLKTWIVAGSLLLSGAGLCQEQEDRIARYLEMLERPEREAFQKPAQVMAALRLRPGERVADLGAGSGYFTIPLARAVAPGGVVWALDIRQRMLDHIAARPGLIDTVLMVDVYHYIHFEKRGAEYAAKLRSGLAPGGRVVIIDYVPKPFDARPWGPPPEQQMSRETLDGYMAAGGLKPAKVHTFLPEQYFVEYVPR